MPDYSRLIDPEVWAFIRKTERFYGPDPHLLDIDEYRRRYDAMCAAFFRPFPGSVSARDVGIGGLDLRLYHHKSARAGVTVLYAHGGSFTLGGLHSHNDVCAEICDATGFEVVAVDYRLSPEFTRQDAVDDMQTALDRIRSEHGGAVIFVGDSAGGYLCAATAQANRDGGDIIGQVLIYPGLFAPQSGGSMDQYAEAPLLTKAEIMQFKEGLGGRSHVPPRSGDFSGLPPTVTLSAACDPLADDARDYAQAVTVAGGTALWFNDTGLVHGHLRARHSSKRTRASFDRVLRAIALLGGGQPLERRLIET